MEMLLRSRRAEQFAWVHRLRLRHIGVSQSFTWDFGFSWDMGLIHYLIRLLTVERSGLLIHLHNVTFLNYFLPLSTASALFKMIATIDYLLHPII